MSHPLPSPTKNSLDTLAWRTGKLTALHVDTRAFNQVVRSLWECDETRGSGDLSTRLLITRVAILIGRRGSESLVLRRAFKIYLRPTSRRHAARAIESPKGRHLRR